MPPKPAFVAVVKPREAAQFNSLPPKMSVPDTLTPRCGSATSDDSARIVTKGFDVRGRVDKLEEEVEETKKRQQEQLRSAAASSENISPRRQRSLSRVMSPATSSASSVMRSRSVNGTADLVPQPSLVRVRSIDLPSKSAVRIVTRRPVSLTRSESEADSESVVPSRPPRALDQTATSDDQSEVSVISLLISSSSDSEGETNGEDDETVDSVSGLDMALKERSEIARRVSASRKEFFENPAPRIPGIDFGDAEKTDTMKVSQLIDLRKIVSTNRSHFSS